MKLRVFDHHLRLSLVGLLLILFVPVIAQNGGDAATDVPDALTRMQLIRGHVVIGVDEQRILSVIRQEEMDLALVVSQVSVSDNIGLRVARDAREEIDRIRVRVSRIMADLEDQLQQFNGYRSDLDRILSASRERIAVDSLNAISFIREDQELLREAQNTLVDCDSLVVKLLDVHERCVRFQVEANAEFYRLSKIIVEEESSLIERRYPPLWNENAADLPSLSDVVVRSWGAVVGTIRTFGEHFWKQLVLLRLVLLGFALWPLWYVKRVLKPRDPTPYGPSIHFLRNYPAEIGAIVFLVITPFLFTHTPRLVIELMFLCMLFPLVRIFLKERSTFGAWKVLVVLAYYMLLKMSNLLVDTTLFQRILLVLSIGTVPFILMLLRYLERVGSHRLQLVRATVIFLCLHVVLGWALALLGWHRLGRNLVTVGLDCFYLVAALYYAVHAVYEYLLLFADRQHRTGGGVPMDLFKARDRLINIQRVIAVMIWGYSYLTGMDLWELIVERWSVALAAPHQILGFAFTFYGIAVFFLVVVLTITISRLLSDLFDVGSGSSMEPRRHGGMLLLRLVVLFGGFTFAVVASGIPLDRMVVLFGAFGVGIGFGLQNLMNNLVSGIMLALENPVRPGDLIQVKDGMGTVMDIGIRSTRLLDYAGAVIVVPNSELISEAVTNRTLTDRTDRVHVHVSVPTSNDIGSVASILRDVVTTYAEEGRRSPYVFMADLSHNWAEFDVYVWVSEAHDAAMTRGRVLESIALAFDRNGIKMSGIGFFPNTHPAQ